MVLKWIFILIALVGLVYSLIKKGKNQKIIAALISTAIAVDFLWDSKYARAVNLLLLLAAAILSIIYAFKEMGVEMVNRVYIGLTGAIFGLFLLVDIFGLPSLRELRIAMLTPLILFIITFFIYKKNTPKEFGFMFMWWTLALVQFVKLF